MSKQKSILIIDDEPSICEFFNSVLTKGGYLVRYQTNGKDAVKLLKSDMRDRYDLVILDLMIPDYGGYAILKELQNEGYNKIPVLVITARALDKDTVEMIRKENNVRDFLEKPLFPEDILSKVSEILG